MKRLLMVLASMLVMATMMTPITASAALFNESNGGRAAWEAAVSNIFTDFTTLPVGNIVQYASYARPSVGFINFDQNLTHTGDFYYTATLGTLNGAVYPQPAGASAFGFELVPGTAGASFVISLYLGPGASQGSISQTVNVSDPAFYGWTDLPVYSFSIVSLNTPFGIGHLVEGGVGTAVPEPSTLLLLGSGLLGLVGYGRKRMKK